MNIDKATMLAELSDIVYSDGNTLTDGFSKYSTQPKTLKFLDNGSAQGAVMKINNDEAVLVFRGTQPTKINDILADLKAWQLKSDTCGEVHAGFKTELDKVYPDVLQWIKGRSVNKKTTTVYVAGHSLGAAMATLCAARLNALGYKVVLYTYGSPRVGDKTWATQFDTIEYYRFVNNNDIVTTVPPHIDYTHVGELHYITYSGTIGDCSQWARIRDKFKGYAKAFQKFQFFNGLYDHSINLYVDKLKHIVK